MILMTDGSNFLNGINWLIFAVASVCSFCGLGTEFLNISWMNLGFKGLSDPDNIFKLANDKTLKTPLIYRISYTGENERVKSSLVYKILVYGNITVSLSYFLKVLKLM
jgi:hypothetical protein